ncbi:Hypothetical predicted protein, partial [Paramuricea clavata]
TSHWELFVWQNNKPSRKYHTQNFDFSCYAYFYVYLSNELLYTNIQSQNKPTRTVLDLFCQTKTNQSVFHVLYFTIVEAIFALDEALERFCIFEQLAHLLKRTLAARSKNDDYHQNKKFMFLIVLHSFILSDSLYFQTNQFYYLAQIQPNGEQLSIIGRFTATIHDDKYSNHVSVQLNLLCLMIRLVGKFIEIICLEARFKRNQWPQRSRMIYVEVQLQYTVYRKHYKSYKDLSLALVFNLYRIYTPILCRWEDAEPGQKRYEYDTILCFLKKQATKMCVPRARVQALLKEIDPCWHVDGYDKLKPFGFPLHGAIDGYSRRMLWLKVTRTNSNPAVIAKYYHDCIEELGGCPRILSTDPGTENVEIATLQCYLRGDGTDDFAGEKAHRYVASTANQRIECWWSSLRRSRTSWWINFFKDLSERGVYISGNIYHNECLWFCFNEILQQDLDFFRVHWNTHYIRQSRHDTIAGKPDELFFLPETFG